MVVARLEREAGVGFARAPKAQRERRGIESFMMAVEVGELVKDQGSSACQIQSFEDMKELYTHSPL